MQWKIIDFKVKQCGGTEVTPSSYVDEAGRSYSSVYADGCRHLLRYTRYNKTKHPSELNAFAKKKEREKNKIP